MQKLKDWARTRLEKAGYVVFNRKTQGLYARDGLFTFNNSHFLADREFQAAYQRGVQAGGGVNPHIEWRVHIALWAAQCALGAEGEFVECGVNQGFISSAILQRLQWQRVERTFVLIDTFGGPVLRQFSSEE